MSKTDKQPQNDKAEDRTGRTVKRKVLPESDIDELKNGSPEPTKQLRKCEKAGCPAKIPICFARSSARCTGSGYTSRWYHVTSGEHFCNECFDHFYRSHKEGYQEYIEWKRIWSLYGKTDASIKNYMSDQLLGYWLQCKKCKKWRQLGRDTKMTKDFVESFVCGSTIKNKFLSKDEACENPEDCRVEWTRDSLFPSLIVVPPLFRNSISGPYLTGYYPDGVGLTPSDTDLQMHPKGVIEVAQYLKPFDFPDEPRRAMAHPPDVMTEDEDDEFPDFAKLPQIYLAIRNTIATLWNLNIKEWVTKELCVPYLICRGITRIWCLENLDRILWFLTRKGFINCGLITVPSKPAFIPTIPDIQHPVIVIGAGASGLAAARQLANFGIKSTVLEARLRVGGRVWDDESLGTCVGRGAQIVTGCINNPIILMCKQTGIEFRELGDNCTIIDNNGEIVDPAMERRMDFHFNAMLDIIAEWRKYKDLPQDTNLLEKYREMHQQFLDESQLKFTKKEEQLIEFHIANIEFACGTSLNQMSAISWDQNEEYPQFAGPHILMKDGYTQLLDKMADGVHFVTNMEVTSIDYSTDDHILVRCLSGSEMKASRVLVTVPLALLKKKCISFTPKLPPWKEETISKLGTGHVEKIALRFKKKFWRESGITSDMFGHVPEEGGTRGLFSVFYDLSSSQARGQGDGVCSCVTYNWRGCEHCTEQV
ncbi:hypothetical protein ACJMK2_003734 [Sinanodonta woodiana]|uniref:SWIRM domain-containing protein n=1 Tax=Sinanodonta woodiana TaxID=1069815 RepID=A0ABD3Y262_SINWO